MTWRNLCLEPALSVLVLSSYFDGKRAWSGSQAPCFSQWSALWGNDWRVRCKFVLVDACAIERLETSEAESCLRGRKECLLLKMAWMLGTVKCIGSTWFGVSMSGICFYVVSFGNGKGIEGTRGQRGLQYPLVRCLLMRSVELAVLAQRCLMQQVPWYSCLTNCFSPHELTQFLASPKALSQLS